MVPCCAGDFPKNTRPISFNGGFFDTPGQMKQMYAAMVMMEKCGRFPPELLSQ